jgi:TonB family protein
MADRRSRWWRPTVAISIAAAIVLGIPHSGEPQESLNAARDLYTAAAYEDALALLDRLKASAHRADDSRYIEQYRAFCLLALGRSDDAEHAIEAVVAVAPFYRPSDSDASPRVRLAFRDVRRRMLPGIIQQRYVEAKATYDRKQTALARNLFRQVLDLLNDPDIATAAGQPPLSELKTLAMGFRDLSANAATAPAPQPRASPPPPPPPQAIGPRIFGDQDAEVVPPVIIRQSLAALSDVFALRPGVLEIIIDENGEVESATIRTSVNPVYDRLVLATAKSWRYRPATLGGEPVKFRRMIQLDPHNAR